MNSKTRSCEIGRSDTDCHDRMDRKQEAPAGSQTTVPKTQSAQYQDGWKAESQAVISSNESPVARKGSLQFSC